MNSSIEASGIMRRLGAMAYDGILLSAVCFVAAALFGIAAGSMAIPQGNVKIFFQFYLLSVSFVFYGWFWVHGGQTLGLRAWSLRVVRRDGSSMTWGQAALRFVSAMFSWMTFGLGIVWVLFDRQHLAWHDRLSQTYVVRLPAVKNG
jgi:uncharacterized RDD family membrane protein YckC